MRQLKPIPKRWKKPVCYSPPRKHQTRFSPHRNKRDIKWCLKSSLGKLRSWGWKYPLPPSLVIWPDLTYFLELELQIFTKKSGNFIAEFDSEILILASWCIFCVHLISPWLTGDWNDPFSTLCCRISDYYQGSTLDLSLQLFWSGKLHAVYPGWTLKKTVKFSLR